MSIGSRWATWVWRWSVVQLVVGAVALVAAFVPAARPEGAAMWVVLGVVVAILVAGFVLGTVAYFGGLATMPTGRVSDTEWNRLTVTQRRRLARALRRGEEIVPEQRDLARWHAERSIRGTLPLATIQGGLGATWCALAALNPIGAGLWWFHVGLGGLICTVVAAMLWVLARMRGSLARLEGAPASSVG